MSIKSLTIYCSSSENLDSEYYDLASNLGKYLAKKSIKIVYGGGNLGLMGTISNTAHNNGGEVIGIITKFLLPKEGLNQNITNTIIVNTMSERKKKLFDMGEAFVILPGGSGTIEEATEVISWKFLGLHNKDIIIFNYKGYWDELIKVYQKARDSKFGNRNLQNICKHINTLKEFKSIF